MQKVTSALAQNIDSVYDVPRILLNSILPAFLTNLLLQIGNQCRCSGASTPSPTPTLVLLLYNPHTQGWAQSSTRTPSCSHSRQKKQNTYWEGMGNVHAGPICQLGTLQMVRTPSSEGMLLGTRTAPAIPMNND